MVHDEPVPIHFEVRVREPSFGCSSICKSEGVHSVVSNLIGCTSQVRVAAAYVVSVDHPPRALMQEVFEVLHTLMSSAANVVGQCRQKHGLWHVECGNGRCIFCCEGSVPYLESIQNPLDLERGEGRVGRVRCQLIPCDNS